MPGVRLCRPRRAAHAVLPRELPDLGVGQVVADVGHLLGGGFLVHKPCGPRKSGMPESVEMPAPVRTTTRFASSTQLPARVRSDFTVQLVSLFNEGRAGSGTHRPPSVGGVAQSPGLSPASRDNRGRGRLRPACRSGPALGGADRDRRAVDERRGVLLAERRGHPPFRLDVAAELPFRIASSRPTRRPPSTEKLPP